MERSKSKHGPVTKFQDKFYHDYPSYRKEERRDGRAKTRRSDSGRSRNRETSRPREKSIDRRPGARPAARSGSVKRFSSQPPERSGRSDVSNWSPPARGGWSTGHSELNEWRAGPGPGQPQVLSLAEPRVGEHPVNIDMVTSVARDCVLACVECHLLAEVHNTVSAQFPTVLEEVIDFRRDHIGSIDVCTRELVYRKNQLRFQFPSPMTNPQYGIQNFAYPAPPQPVRLRD